MLMGFAATLLPKILLPSDGEFDGSSTTIYNVGHDPYYKDVPGEFVIYLGYESYVKFHKELGKQFIAQYHGRKKSG